MQLDADDLLAQIRADWPLQYELSQLRLLSTRQAAEIDRLNTHTPPAYSASVPRPFLTDDPEGRHA